MNYDYLDSFFSGSLIHVYDREAETKVDLNGITARMNSLRGCLTIKYYVNLLSMVEIEAA